MKPSLRQILIKSFLPVFSAVMLVAGIAYAVWTEPTANPPGNNAEAPINVGSISQYKSGALGIGGLLRGYGNAIFDGNVGIGTTGPGQKLTIEGTAPIAEIRSGGYLMLRPTANDWDMRLQAVSQRLDFLSGGDLANPRMTILQNGNVGIGTIDPQVKLDVRGNTNIAGQFGVAGNSSFGGNITGNNLIINQICLNGDCRTTWPSASASPNPILLGGCTTYSTDAQYVNGVGACGGTWGSGYCSAILVYPYADFYWYKGGLFVFNYRCGCMSGTLACSLSGYVYAQNDCTCTSN